LTPHLRVALLEPDIPQNTGTILRLAACLGVEAHIIEPAGFPTTDRAFRRAGMDYLDRVDIVRHQSWKAFETWRSTASARLILFTTRAQSSYLDHAYQRGDVLLFGRESSGAGEKVHAAADARLSFRCGQACARSTWRWQRQWRWAKQCDRSRRQARKRTRVPMSRKHEAGERQYTPQGVAPHPHRSLGACRHPPLAKSPRKRGFDIALPDPPHAQRFPKQWQKKAQLQFSPVQTPRAHRDHARNGTGLPRR